MTRLFIVMAVLLGLVSPCQAKSYRELPLPELVAGADVIVVGTVAEAGDEYRVKVDQALTEGGGPEVTFPRSQDTDLRVGQTQLLFLVSGKEGLALVYPLAYEPPDRTDEVRRLLDMKMAPGKYLADPKFSESADYLAMLGWVFEDEDRVGKLTKADAVEHLRKSLRSDDKQAVLEAVAGLRRTGSRGAATAVFPLLRHPDEQVRIAAVKFLEWAGDRRAVEPLCKALDEVESPSDFGRYIGRALGNLRDPTAAPALERAVKRGIDGWPGWALGVVGSKASFEVLLDRVEKHDSMGAADGLRALIHRSNKRHEPWMSERARSRKTGLKHRDKWRKWWDANKSDFRIIKTADEAFGPGK